MKIDGRCHCGYVTFEAEADANDTAICHCTDCQMLSGSAFRTVVLTQKGSFKIRSGELKIYVKKSESGTQRPQAFCPECRRYLYPSESEPFVSALSLHQEFSFGAAQPNTG